MRAFLALAAGMLIAASAVCAQTPDPPLIDSCKLIKDNAARLRCFDRAISRTKSDALPTPIGPAPGAKSEPVATSVSPAPGPESESSAAPNGPVPGFKPETPDPATPSLRERLAPVIGDLVSTPVIGRIFNSGGAKAPTWQIKVDKASLYEASQVWGLLDSVDGKSILALRCKDNNAEAAVSTRSFLGWDQLRVLYRVNDGPPTEGYWAATDGKSAALPANEAISFINSLTDNGNLFIRVFDYDGTAHDAKFGLGAVSDLRARIAIVCKWPTADTAGTLSDPQSAAPKASAVPGAARPVGAPLQLN